ncbi:MAG: hypothetical protein Ct9H90mP16_13710 [Candidatus Poseidoniales archaeon]|nr:MAG: hypothetical protein Ct9H90mP16_13710 [Candidatus Poseidoniales archaeon]
METLKHLSMKSPLRKDDELGKGTTEGLPWEG